MGICASSKATTVNPVTRDNDVGKPTEPSQQTVVQPQQEITIRTSNNSVNSGTGDTIDGKINVGGTPSVGDCASPPTQLQIEHAWDPNHCSENFKVLDDEITAKRNDQDDSTDAIRGKRGYRSGVREFEVYWPRGQRDKYAMLGVVTSDTRLTKLGTTYLLGSTSSSWGWNLTNKKLVHDDNILGTYPESSLSQVEIRDTVKMVLDIFNNTISFCVGDTDLGVAFENVSDTEPLYIAASTSQRNCQITMKYLGKEESVSVEDKTISIISDVGKGFDSESCGSDHIPIPDGESYYTFHDKCGKNVQLFHHERVSRRRHANKASDHGVTLTREALVPNERFEVKLDSTNDRWRGCLEIGVTSTSAENLDFPATMTNYEDGYTMMWSGTYIYVNGLIVGGLDKDLDDCTIGDSVGLRLDDNGTVSFYFNGEKLSDEFTLDKYQEYNNFYGVVDIYGKANGVTICEKGYQEKRGSVSDMKREQMSIQEDSADAVMVHMRLVALLLKFDLAEVHVSASLIESSFSQPLEKCESHPEIQQKFGDHLANLGIAECVEHLLGRLMSKGKSDKQDWNTLYILRCFCWNYSDASLRMCKQFGECGIIKRMLDDLDNYGPNCTDNQQQRFVLRSAFGVLDNCAKAEANRQLYHDLRGIERISPFMRCKDLEIAMCALLTLSYIVEDDKTSLLQADPGVISRILRLLRDAIKDQNLKGSIGYSSFHALELVIGLGNIAINDTNKMSIVNDGGAELLVEAMTKEEKPLLQECAANTLWTLAKLDRNREKISGVRDIYSTLDTLCQHENRSIVQAAERVLCILRTPVKTAEEPMINTQPNTKRHCAYQELCRKFKNSLEIIDNYFDGKYDECFCTPCHASRNDGLYYTRGVPAKEYGVPIEWCRFGLKVDDARAADFDIFKKWHVAFHGTKADSVKPILRTGSLLLPGDTTLEGKELSVVDGHIKEEEGKKMKFDVKQMFVSPSIRYSGGEHYAKPCDYIDSESGKSYQAQVALQVKINPESYNIGAQTIGATSPIDPRISNQELEWFTKQRGAIIHYGLLVKLTEE